MLNITLCHTCDVGCILERRGGGEGEGEGTCAFLQVESYLRACAPGCLPARQTATGMTCRAASLPPCWWNPPRSCCLLPPLLPDWPEGSLVSRTSPSGEGPWKLRRQAGCKQHGGLPCAPDTQSGGHTGEDDAHGGRERSRQVIGNEESIRYIVQKVAARVGNSYYEHCISATFDAASGAS